MHVYELVGSEVRARHFVEMATRPGELRPTRISDFRKWRDSGLAVVPSVTEIINILSKPGLVNWKIDRHLLIAHQNAPEDWRDNPAPWLAEIKRLTELEMAKAPDAGSDLHKSLENYFTLRLDVEHPDWPICNAVEQEINVRTRTPDDAWHAERKFISPLGYGGQVDLSNDSWIIDFKTKQDASKWKPGKMAYPDHAMQLAAYRRGLFPNETVYGVGPRAANCFICPENGEIDFHEHSEDELRRGWEMFEHCLALWKLQHL